MPDENIDKAGHKRHSERISLEAENAGLALYRQLCELVPRPLSSLGRIPAPLIAEEELHVGEVNKMLRKPGEITQFQA